MLNDDDEEIRDAAAVVASKLLRGQGFLKEKKDAVPIVTVQRLGESLSKLSSDPEGICKEALHRLTGTPEEDTLFTQPFAETLAEKRKEDTALFTQEKQNLYKDDPLDATFWATILRSIEPTKVPGNYASGLKEWVLDGLNTLTETAKNEIDGALGWTNKPEVFTLGMAVIYATEITMTWKDADLSKIMAALRHLVDVGTESELNGIWLEKIEGVLENAAARLDVGADVAWPEYGL
jgi:hypothetical protein